MSIDNLRLRTKAIIPLVMMAATVLAMVGFGAVKLSGISSTASEIIEHRDLAVATQARATRSMVLVPYYVFANLTYDSDSPEGRGVDAGFAKAISDANALLDDAAKLLPEKAAEYGAFKTRFDAIVEKAKAPGMARGRQLKPEELDKMAESAKLIAEVDQQTIALVKDIVSFGVALLDGNAKAAAELRADSRNALTMMAVVGVVATMLCGAFSIWMSSSKIARPLARLADRMKALAQGNLTVEIEGQQRRDEVGEMAAAVQVFKVNAVERVRAEAEAAEHREAAEKERERSANEKAKAAEEQAEAMRRLGEGSRIWLPAIFGSTSTTASRLNSRRSRRTSTMRSTS
jgi:methyl-accepting chemotaxis protein